MTASSTVMIRIFVECIFFSESLLSADQFTPDTFQVISFLNLPEAKEQLAGAYNFSASPPSIFLRNVGASTYHNPMGLHGLLQE
jgi:hypothetical protein